MIKITHGWQGQAIYCLECSNFYAIHIENTWLSLDCFTFLGKEKGN